MLCQDRVGRGQVCVEGVEQGSEGAELLNVTGVLQKSRRPRGLDTHPRKAGNTTRGLKRARRSAASRRLATQAVERGGHA